MGTKPRSADETPEARLDFARRLRELRIPRGFRTARSLARALEIDENRYTRYERAEVEPDLDMIRRICTLLDVSPNDLLCNSNENGHGGNEHHLAASDRARATGGFANRTDGHLGDGAASVSAAFSISTAAWHLAEAIGQAEQTSSDALNAATVVSPLSSVKRTGELYTDLMHHPFAAIAAILAQPVVSNTTADHAAAIKESIATLISLLKSNSPTA